MVEWLLEDTKTQIQIMDSAKTELADKLKTSNNVLVTVSRDPSVDQLASLLALSLLLNKLGKHCAAVFSGQIPSTIEFLQPEQTIEKNTDSLRDFIIALDKSKADKLRYKVEDNVVRIFITPYRTSISEADLNFSQGDFNVDVVVALGVMQQEDLDQAITAHGRILHDATVATVNLAGEVGLGSVNWQVPQASSLCELVTDLAPMLGDNLIDGQIATALLTGIVAETERFSNNKTSPQTMSASAVLMAAGANQQLVASQLEQPPEPPVAAPPEVVNSVPERSDDGTLEIAHPTTPDVPEEDKYPAALQLPEIPDNDDETQDEQSIDQLLGGSRLITEEPSLGGQLTANTEPEGLSGSADPLSNPIVDAPLLEHHDPTSAQPEPGPSPLVPPTDVDRAAAPAFQPRLQDRIEPRTVDSPANTPSATLVPAPVPLGGPQSTEPMPAVPADKTEQDSSTDPQTLSDLEAAVHSPHMAASNPGPTQPTHLDTARDEVSRALSQQPGPPEPVQALNARPLGGQLHQNDELAPPPGFTADPNSMQATGFGTSPTPAAAVPPTPAPSLPGQPTSNPTQVSDPTAPPPVPPPIPFQFKPPQKQ